MDATQLLNPNLQMQWDYDSEADVLYISVGDPQPALGVDIGEGLILRYSEAQSNIVGLTVVGLKSRLEQERIVEAPKFASPLHRLDTVALIEPIPDYNLLPGQVGTIVEQLASNVYQVEFRDDEQTYATISLNADQLIRLRYSPAQG